VILLAIGREYCDDITIVGGGPARAKKKTLKNLYASASFKPRSEIEQRSEIARSFEKFLYGTFQKKL